MKIIVDGKLPSWNTLYSGVHWGARKATADLWHELVHWAVYQTPNKPTLPFVKPVTIDYEVHYKNANRRDIDNVNIKLLNDGLVHAGVLIDDSNKYIEEISIRVVTKSTDKIIITINDFKK